MSINKVICIGNLTRNAEVRTVGQNQVAKVGLAMTEKFRKQDGTIGENTEFIDIEVWGQAGVYPYLLKGQMVYVEGSLKTQKWTGQDGAQHQQTFIKAASIQLLGQRPQAQQPAAAQQAAPAPQYQQAPPQYGQAPAPQPQAPAYPHAPTTGQPAYPPPQGTAPAPQYPPQAQPTYQPAQPAGQPAYQPAPQYPAAPAQQPQAPQAPPAQQGQQGTLYPPQGEQPADGGPVDDLPFDKRPGQVA